MLRLGVIAGLLIGCLVAAGSRHEREGQAVVAATTAGASLFTPVTPQRLVDTRIGLGAPTRPLAAGSSLDVQVTGRLAIPANATAVVANLTAVEADRPGYLQMLPTGRATLGSSSTLNIDAPGQTLSNAAFAPLGDNGRLTVYGIVTTDVVIDISGYFTPATTSKAGRLVPLTPTRILDTRVSLGWKPPPTTTTTTTTASPTVPPNPGDSKNCGDFDTYQQAKAWFDLYYPYYGDVANLDADDNLIPCESLSGSPEGFGLAENVAAGTTITLRVAGRGGVPKSGVSAVVMNVTAVEPTSFGYVQVAPTPVVPRATSNLNTAPGRTIANLVVVPLGAAGSVDLFTTTPADLVADVVGYFTDTTAPQSGQGLFVPITPDRQFDSRQPPPRNPLPADTITSIDVNDISPDAIAIAGNLTATQAVQPGYLQLAAPPISARTSSNLNLSYPGQTIANAVVSPVANGQLRLYNRNPTHELLDVTGWFTSAVSSLPPSPTTTTTTPKKTTTTTTTVEPTTTLPSDPDPKIAFTRANQIYTINPDGTGEAKLTSGNKNYWPRWSPDGNRIAYVHEVAGAHSLWVMNANGTNKQQITDQNTSYGPAWSPDGAWLAFGVTSGDPRWGNLARIKSTAPFGSPQAFPSWVDDPADLDPQTGIRGTPAWSASRNEIYFFGNDLTGIYDQAILAYDVATQELSMLTAIGGGGSYGSIAEPAISTDGTMLAYTYTLSPPSVTQEVGPLIDLYSYPSMTSLPFTTFEEDSQLAFSRTDTRVALMNDSAGAAQIFIAEADGSGRQPLTNGYQPDWQPR